MSTDRASPSSSRPTPLPATFLQRQWLPGAAFYQLLTCSDSLSRPLGDRTSADRVATCPLSGTANMWDTEAISFCAVFLVSGEAEMSTRYPGQFLSGCHAPPVDASVDTVRRPKATSCDRPGHPMLTFSDLIVPYRLACGGVVFSAAYAEREARIRWNRYRQQQQERRGRSGCCSWSHSLAWPCSSSIAVPPGGRRNGR